MHSLKFKINPYKPFKPASFRLPPIELQRASRFELEQNITNKRKPIKINQIDSLFEDGSTRSRRNSVNFKKVMHKHFLNLIIYFTHMIENLEPNCI